MSPWVSGRLNFTAIGAAHRVEAVCLGCAFPGMKYHHFSNYQTTKKPSSRPVVFKVELSVVQGNSDAALRDGRI